jgi:hypothetical protein
MNNIMGEYLEESKVIPMIPGDVTFIKVPVTNHSQMQKAYSITIDDPQADLFLDGRREVQMIYT